MALREKLFFKLNNERKQLLALWILYLIPMIIYFSFTNGLMHRYYLSTMAPAVAALSGIGIVCIWQQYKTKTIKGLFLPSTLLVTGITQYIILSYYESPLKAFKTALLVLTVTSACVLVISRFTKAHKSVPIAKVTALIALVVILLSPAIWSLAPIIHGTGRTLPAAEFPSRTTEIRAIRSENNLNSYAINYLMENRGDAKYLAAAQSANGLASGIIIETGQSVMAIGGFNGSDKILSLDDFVKLVSDGEVKYFIMNGLNDKANMRNPGDDRLSQNIQQGNSVRRPPAGNAASSNIMQWIMQNGKIVDERLYNDSVKPMSNITIIELFPTHD